MNFAWPTAEIAAMGAKGAAEIIFRKEIREAEDHEAKLAEKEAEYSEALQIRIVLPTEGMWMT